MRFRPHLALVVVFVCALASVAAPTKATVPPTCLGWAATMVGSPDPEVLLGTAGPDVLLGTAGPDVVVGLGGDDTIETYGGDDIVCAGSGDDIVDLGPGNDVAAAGPGDDVVRGRGGNDRIFGRSGDDHLDGGMGSDTVVGGTGADTAFGGHAADKCASSEVYRFCETINRRVEIESLLTDGLPDLARSWHVEEVDFNKDDVPDLLITTHHNGNTGDPGAGHAPDGVYLSNGQGSFLHQELPYLRYRDRHQCNAGDFNADGLVDFFCAIGGGRGNALAKSDELLIQLPDGTFEDQYGSWGIDDPQRRSRYQVVADFNGDGYDDIFGTAAGPIVEGAISQSRLWLSAPGHGFLPAPEWGLDGIEHSAARGDCLAGNAEFIAVCGSSVSGEPFRIFGNTGAGFVALSTPPSWERVTGVSMGDTDNDGDLEFLIAVFGAGELAIYLPHTQTYSVLPTKANLKMAATGDFDGDGFMDIYLLNRGRNCKSLIAEGPTPARPGGVNAADTIAFGPTFTHRATVDVPTQGCGDVVVAFDTDGDGNDEAIVTNGHLKAWGPYFIVDMVAGPTTVPNTG